MKEPNHLAVGTKDNERFHARIFVKRTEETETLQKLHQASLALKDLGILFHVGPNRQQGFKNYLACTLSITIDHAVTSRGAGRPLSISEFTLADIEQMLSEKIPAKDIAAQVGISLATYYRHMSRAKELQRTGQSPSDIKF